MSPSVKYVIVLHQPDPTPKPFYTDVSEAVAVKKHLESLNTDPSITYEIVQITQDDKAITTVPIVVQSTPTTDVTPKI